MDEVVGGCILRDNSDPGRKRSAVDGHGHSCGVNDDHGYKFGRPPTAVSDHQHSTPEAMLDSRVEPSVPSRKSPPPLWRPEVKEGR